MPQFDTPELKSAISKAVKHLMPMLVILYVVAFLDRTNVGFAEQSLEVDRNISSAAYALGAGIFFIGYAIFEIPSNLLLRRFGAKVWLARIAISWGVVAAAFAFVQNEQMFIVLRFLLGVTEAGLFPGVIMFLSDWFPNKLRVRMFALFYLAQPISQIIGSPLSGGLISFGNVATPFAGWQVMFFVEGSLAVIAGVISIFVLVDSPQKAKWLSGGERSALLQVMHREDSARNEDSPQGIRATLRNWKVWYFTVIYFCLQIAVYGVTFYLPQQVAALIGQDVGWQVGLVAAIPWAAGFVICYLVGRSANSVRRRRNFAVSFLLATSIGIFGSAWAGATGQPLLGLAFITIAVASFLSTAPIAWSFPTAFLSGAAAATGIGLINSLGNLGGFVAPIMRTAINDSVPTASGYWGIVSLTGFALAAAALMFGTRFFKTTKADTLLIDVMTVPTDKATS